MTLQTQYRIGIVGLLNQCTTKTTHINHVTQNDTKRVKEKLLYLFDFQKYAIKHPEVKLQVKMNTKTFYITQRKLVQTHATNVADMS